jgi:hypothetical protein
VFHSVTELLEANFSIVLVVIAAAVKSLITSWQEFEKYAKEL